MRAGRLIRRIWGCWALAAALLIGAVPAMAGDQDAAKDPLTVTLTIKKVTVDAQGKELLVEGSKVKPGDLVEYEAVYANIGDRALGNVLAMLPLPTEMEYEARSARPTTALASIDGRQFATEPLMRTVIGKDGKSISETVPYTEYRALRWQIKLLEPGKNFTAKARARVSRTLPEPVVLPVPGAAKSRGGGS